MKSWYATALSAGYQASRSSASCLGSCDAFNTVKLSTGDGAGVVVVVACGAAGSGARVDGRQKQRESSESGEGARRKENDKEVKWSLAFMALTC